MQYGFEWDFAKARLNEQKHGVTFEEAQTVFVDPWAISRDDRFHSDREERFIIIGMSQRENVLTVVYCYRQELAIRLISARRALPNERRTYEEKRSHW